MRRRFIFSADVSQKDIERYVREGSSTTCEKRKRAVQSLMRTYILTDHEKRTKELEECRRLDTELPFQDDYDMGEEDIFKWNDPICIATSQTYEETVQIVEITDYDQLVCLEDRLREDGFDVTISEMMWTDTSPLTYAKYDYAAASITEGGGSFTYVPALATLFKHAVPFRERARLRQTFEDAFLEHAQLKGLTDERFCRDALANASCITKCHINRGRIDLQKDVIDLINKIGSEVVPAYVQVDCKHSRSGEMMLRFHMKPLLHEAIDHARIIKRERKKGENNEEDGEPGVTVTFGDHEISFPTEYPYVAGLGRDDDKQRYMCITVDGEILAAQRVVPAQSFRMLD